MNSPPTIGAGQRYTSREHVYVVQTSDAHLRVIRVQVEGDTSAGPERGPAGLMSAGSRRRLMYFLNRVDFSHHVNRTFITFGFPDEVDCFSYKQRTYWRNRFHCEIERRFKRRFPMMWRQEWIRRKSGKRLGETMPHYHTMFLDMPFVPQGWLCQCWQRVLKGCEQSCVVDVRRVYNEDGAIKYVAKYVSKLPSLDICPYLDKRMQVGRPWGVRRKNLVVLRPMTESFLESQETIEELLAFANVNLKRCKEASNQGFTLYGELATLAKVFLGKKA